jgi:hypothetical protein
MSCEELLGAPLRVRDADPGIELSLQLERLVGNRSPVKRQSLARVRDERPVFALP